MTNKLTNSFALTSILLLAFCYFLSGQVGQVLNVSISYATAIWPPSGVALAALLIGGSRLWPGIVLGAYLFNLKTVLGYAAKLTWLSSVVIPLTIAGGATLQALVAMWSLKKCGLYPIQFRKLKRVAGVVVVGGAFACVTSATVGVSTLYLSGAMPYETLPFNWFSWWLGDTMGVFLVTGPVVFWWNSTGAERKQALYTVLIPIALIFTAAIVVFVLQLEWDEKETQLSFDKQVEQLSLVLDNQLRRERERVESLQSFYRASNYVDRKEFKEFTSQMLTMQTEVQAIEWAPVISKHELTEFYHQMEKEGLSGFKVREKSSDGSMVPAKDRELHIPVSYIEPFETNLPALGFDLASDPSRLQALRLAAETGQTTVSAAVQLVQDSATIPAVLLIGPIYNAPEAKLERSKDILNQVHGFVVSVVRVPELLNTAWESWNAKDLAIEIYDTTDPDKRQLLASFGSEKKQELPAEDTRSIDLEMAGRTWQIQFYLTDTFRAAHSSFSPWIVLVVGMALTGVLGFFILVRAEQTRWIQDLNAQLADDKDRLQSLLDQVLSVARDGIVTATFSETVASMNPAAKRIFGLEDSQMAGRKIRDILPDLNLSAASESSESLLELEGLDRNNHKIPIEVGVSALPGDTEGHYLIILRDITQRKAAQKKLLEFNQELQRSNEELDEFAYIASHDLKEPLRGISNYSNFLIEDYGNILDEEGLRKLNTLISLTKRMEQLIDSLLEFSRVGRSTMKVRRVNPRSLVEGVRESFQITLEEQHVDLNIQEDFPEITCDTVYVQEVFGNLVSNSMKYNNKEEKHINVGWEPFDPKKHQPRLEDTETLPEEGVPVFYVKDNGIGIRERHLDNVFKLFRRLHGRDKYGGGHGAGLTIVKKIVERHGGTIWVQSVYGEGSTFYFTLPNAPETAVAALDG